MTARLFRSASLAAAHAARRAEPHAAPGHYGDWLDGGCALDDAEERRMRNTMRTAADEADACLAGGGRWEPFVASPVLTLKPSGCQPAELAEAPR